MTDRQKRFIDLLRTIFELDKSDLDFGIYRILNIRSAEIEKFFAEELPKKITETLEPFAQGDTTELKAQMKQIEDDAIAFGTTIEAMPDTNPKKQRWNEIRQQLAQGSDLSALESDVYSALYSFFNRYYDEGDFISKRRYKEGVYAIPYEGEEVKLYWANQDQYYIKTSENFKDYTFVADDVTVHFRIVDATIEQNNNKEANDKKRQFMLFTPNEETHPGLETFSYDAERKELIIRFVYDIPADTKKKTEKWTEDNFKAISKYILDEHQELMPILLRDVSAKRDGSLLLMQKHLKGYVAKNTFDYFIHKDLGGFLNRELDFYIKNEIMHLDDLDTQNEARVNTYLAKVKAIKRVGKIIIAFLAQLENFQKKLWLKKKFVVETNWCITIDRVSETFYPEIIANAAQVQEWIDMYAIDEVKGDGMFTHDFSNPPSIDFLKENQYLLVDTKHFNEQFKQRLIATIDNLDEATNGVMINGDNFHALSLLQERFKNQIDCIYIDPPYNSPSSEVLYKNSYKHSSWLSLLYSRLQLSTSLASEKGSHCIAIDKYEQDNLFQLCKMVFKDSDLVSVAIEHNKKGTIGDHFSYSNEFAIFAISNKLKHLNEKPRNKDDWDYSNLRNWGGESERGDAANCFFPIYVMNNQIIGFGDVLDDKIHPESANEIVHQEIRVYTPQGEFFFDPSNGDEILCIWPIDSEGIERKWRYAFQSINEVFEFLILTKGRDGLYQIKMPKRSDQFKTLWSDYIYNAGDYGTKVLSSLGFSTNDFAYPKSIYTVRDCTFAISNKLSYILDYFAGSGTTGHAVLNLNKKDGGKRKYILVEMGKYFDTVTLPRIKKVIYSPEWKDGKPIARDKGVSQIVKYMRLESYEDALSNIELKKQGGASLFGDDYLLHYMLDIEARGSLLNVEAFTNPFDYKLNITEKNETHKRLIDVAETFNYLIGLSVINDGSVSYFRAVDAAKPEYEGAVDLIRDHNGEYAFRLIDGKLPNGQNALIIWRTIGEDLVRTNAALDAYVRKYRINPREMSEYDVIFVNGDNNLENLRTDEEHWKVIRTETAFNEKMWEE